MLQKAQAKAQAQAHAKAHADVAFCYQRAEQIRRMAERLGDPALRNSYLDLEQRWVRLALSYEDSEQYIRFTAELACTLDEMKKT
jgi:hypothetical protein